MPPFENIDWVIPTLVLSGAFLIGLLLAALLVYQISVRGGQANLTPADVSVVHSLLTDLTHTATLSPANVTDYLKMGQEIVVAHIGAQEPPLVIESLDGGISLLGQAPRFAPEEYLFSVVAELEKETVVWLERKNPLSRLGNGRRKHMLAFMLVDGERFRHILQPVPNIPARKRRGLAAMLRAVMITVNTMRAKARALHFSDELVGDLQVQITNLWQVLGGIQHNFRGIFNAGAPEIQMLAARQDRGDDISNEDYQHAIAKFAPGIRILVNLADSMKETTQQILLSNTAEDCTEAHDMRELFQENFGDWLQRQRELRIASLDVIVDLPYGIDIVVDRTTFFQVVWNVLHNAFKYTKRGTITISTYEGIDTLVYLTVEDTGPGIPEEDLEDLGSFEFRAEHTQSEPGHGVGLWYSKFLLEGMGGEMAIDSVKGKGSRFALGFKGTKQGVSQARTEVS